MFQRHVDTLVTLLRIPPQDPLAQFSGALDKARELIQMTFPDPFLATQIASEVVREALARLGFPRPPRLPVP